MMIIEKKNLKQQIVILLLFILGGSVVSLTINQYKDTWFFYWIYMILFLLFSFWGECLKNKKIVHQLMLTVLLSGPMAFRYEMAIDDPSYMRIFNSILNNGWKYLFDRQEEIGFLFVEKIISKLFSDYYICQAFIIIIPTFLIIKYIYQNSNYYNNNIFFFFFYLTLYYKFMAAGLNRMYMALCLVLYSYEYMKKEQVTGYVSIVLFASFFHISALIMLIFVPLVMRKSIDKKIKNWYKYYLMIITVIFAGGFLSYNFFANFLSGRYAQYVGAQFSINLDISVIIRIILFVILILFKKSQNTKDEFMDSLIIIYYSSILVDIFWSNLVLGRIIYYMELAIALTWSHIVRNEKKIFTSFFYIILFGSYLWILFYATILSNERLLGALFPYISFVNQR